VELDLMIEGQEGVTWPQWVALAQACEEHGIPALLRSDHYLNLDGEHPGRAALDAWTTLAGLAAVTTRLRLGTLVSPATFRHPSVLAKAVATVDHISGGRVELGLGAGWHEREHAAYGFAFADLRTRMDVLEEQLQVVHGAWADEPFTFAGEHYRLADLRAEPKPVQRPHPPLIMGGNAGPRAARLAATYADEYNTVFASVEEIRDRKARIDAACRARGREPIPFSVMTGVVVGETRADVRERAAGLARVEGAAPETIDAWLADPPQGWLVGTVDEVVALLRERADAGVARVMCQHLVHDDLDMVSLLGREVAPAVS
jgi:F420-dependent oxidoreductase-like protein